MKIKGSVPFSSYIHKVGALSDAAIRFSKALDWSEATSDVDRDPLIIDLDGDGIETRAMKDAGYRCRLPSGLLNRAANDNVVSKVWKVA